MFLADYITGTIDVSVFTAFVFGVLFVSIMLIFAVFVPNPSQSSQWIFITILALASAGVGAVIPGMLQIDFPYIKAGGALALFLVVFATKPAIVHAVAKIEAPTTSALPVINGYLKLIDDGKIDEALNTLDSESPGASPAVREEIRQVYSAGRTNLGKVLERIRIGQSGRLLSPSGYPEGLYVVHTYKTKFASGLCHLESVSVRAKDSTQWKVFDHNVSPSPMPC